MTPNTSKSLRAGASSYAEDAAGAASHALDSTRQFAGQAIDRAGEKARDLRENFKGLASKSVDTVSEAQAAAQRRLGQYAQATTRYVADHPVKSALIAAAVGAAIAALVLAWRNRDRNRYY